MPSSPITHVCVSNEIVLQADSFAPSSVGVAILPEEQLGEEEDGEGDEGKENVAAQAALDYQQQMARQAHVQNAAAKMSQYMQTTQNAADRAAAAQAPRSTRTAGTAASLGLRRTAMAAWRRARAACSCCRRRKAGR